MHLRPTRWLHKKKGPCSIKRVSHYDMLDFISNMFELLKLGVLQHMAMKNKQIIMGNTFGWTVSFLPMESSSLAQLHSFQVLIHASYLALWKRQQSVTRSSMPVPGSPERYQFVCWFRPLVNRYWQYFSLGHTHNKEPPHWHFCWWTSFSTTMCFRGAWLRVCFQVRN